MTTARTVPVTTEMDGDELDAEDAWHLARRHGLRTVPVGSFVRFRYGDGFTNSRALALQTCLAVVPFLLARDRASPPTSTRSRWSRVVAATIECGVAGRSGGDDALARRRRRRAPRRPARWRSVLGLLFALVSMTTAMAQVERGSNRIYGIRRDRPARGSTAAPRCFTAVLAVPVGLGFVLLVAGGAFGDAMVGEYGWSERSAPHLAGLRWPAGLLLARVRHRRAARPRAAPAPAGAVVAGAGLGRRRGAEHGRGRRAGGYVNVSGVVRQHLRPLAGMFALLVWSLMSSIALFSAWRSARSSRRCAPASPSRPSTTPGRPHSETLSDE